MRIVVLVALVACAAACEPGSAPVCPFSACPDVLVGAEAPSPDSGLADAAEPDGSAEDGAPADLADPGHVEVADQGPADLADPGPDAQAPGGTYRISDLRLLRPTACLPGVVPCSSVTPTIDQYLATTLQFPGQADVALVFAPTPFATPASLIVGPATCSGKAGSVPACSFASGASKTVLSVTYPSDGCGQDLAAPCFQAAPASFDIILAGIFMAFRGAVVTGTFADGAVFPGMIDTLVPVKTTQSVQFATPDGQAYLLYDLVRDAPVEDYNGVPCIRFILEFKAEAATVGG